MRRLIRNLVQKMQRANIHGPTEGATTQTKGGFGDKEKAVENVWARQAEAEKMKALREALREQKKTTEQLIQRLDEFSKKETR
ncbi:hypothetical protein VTP01DRAFT_7058 [Rhizomucor pusillus]|uniref:uncharacterized protein n=1 Tax=Rhizomucor pusillus TaxID=4840 RepID=UPI003743FBD7